MTKKTKEGTNLSIVSAPVKQTPWNDPDSNDLHRFILSGKKELEDHLSAITFIMNELAEKQIDVNFGINRDAEGKFDFALSITRRY